MVTIQSKHTLYKSTLLLMKRAGQHDRTSIWPCLVIEDIATTYKHVLFDTVQPWLSGPRLSGTSIIWTSWRPEFESTCTLPCMHRGVANDFCGYAYSQNWLTSVISWTLLVMIIPYNHCLQARYHKPGEKCRHFSYPHVSLIQYGSDLPTDKCNSIPK